MISNEQLEKKISQAADVSYVKVSGDGYHYQILIVSDAFVNKSKVARQQWVYVLLNDYISTGELHAVSMQTFTQAEWEKQHG